MEASIPEPLRALSNAEIAQVLRLSPRTVQRRRATGDLPRESVTLEALFALPTLTAKQAGVHVQRSAATITRWRRMGRLPGTRSVAGWRYSVADVCAAAGTSLPVPGTAAAAGTAGQADPCQWRLPEASSGSARGDAPSFEREAPSCADDVIEPGKRRAPCTPADVRLEPEVSPRGPAGGWFLMGERRVFAPRRAYRVLEVWLARARPDPTRRVSLTIEEIARAVPTSVAHDDVVRSRRVGFATVRGIMASVSAVLREAGLRRPRARVAVGSYELPSLDGCGGEAAHEVPARAVQGPLVQGHRPRASAAGATGCEQAAPA